MKVILLQDVKKVGKKNETIEVSDGYANNFLIARKLAVPLSKKSTEILENQKEEARLNEEKAVADAKELAKKLETITLEFKVKVGKDGRPFGSISLKQVEDTLKQQFHIEIDKRKFIDKGAMNSLGFYKLRIELHRGVQGVINVHIGEEGK